MMLSSKELRRRRRRTNDDWRDRKPLQGEVWKSLLCGSEDLVIRVDTRLGFDAWKVQRRLLGHGDHGPVRDRGRVTCQVLGHHGHRFLVELRRITPTQRGCHERHEPSFVFAMDGGEEAVLELLANVVLHRACVVLIGGHVVAFNAIYYGGRVHLAGSEADPAAHSEEVTDMLF